MKFVVRYIVAAVVGRTEVETELPLFPGYLFCRMNVLKRMPIVTTPGVAGIFGFANEPLPIAADEIQTVWGVLRSGLAEPSRLSGRVEDYDRVYGAA